ncbi:MAG TPA: lysophospholipid acyltransferase family protein [Anaerolineaceae bacterium]|nr:lysophospholipid acyltransferase family protein [Anaerolineaceae bacterium]
MKLRDFLQDEGLVRLGKGLGKNLSLRGIRRLANFVSGILNRYPKNQMRRVIKGNLSVVLDEEANSDIINALSKEVIRNLMWTHADYFYLYQHPEESKSAIEFSSNALEMIEDVRERRQPTVICGPHYGNFDLLGLSLARKNVPMMVLSVPNPQGTYSAQNEMRNKSGMNVRPIDMKAIRDAKKFLLEGNAVVTGIDRPVEDPKNAKYKPLFFGKPAALPVFYTRFGLEEGVKLRVAYCKRKSDGRYIVDCSAPVEMRQYDDLKEEYEKNAQATLREAEKIIRKEPEHWLMLHPVWEN